LKNTLHLLLALSNTLPGPQGIALLSFPISDYSGSADNSDAINNLLTSFTAPRFKVRYHDSPWLFPVTLPGPISNMSTVILEGLGALDGQHPENDSICNNWLVFDKHKLHLPTPEALDRLPMGSELIFVPSTIARPSTAKENI
jgi:hypothetical protein